MMYIIAVFLLVGVGVVAFLIMKKDDSTDDLKIEESISNQIMPDESPAQELVIQVEKLPADAIPDKNKLVEIKDSKILASVNSLIPDLIQASNAVNNVAQAVQESGEVLYRAIIPSGAKLADSKGMEGAVRLKDMLI